MGLFQGIGQMPEARSAQALVPVHIEPEKEGKSNLSG